MTHTSPHTSPGPERSGLRRRVADALRVAAWREPLRRLLDRGRTGLWKQEHEGLRAAVRRTREDVWAVVEGLERWERPLRVVRRGRRRLEELERFLAAHFAREEAQGHLEQALQVAPRYSNRARRLREEHAQMLREMRRIRLMALGADLSSRDWADVYQVYDALAERLRLHDEAENEIAMTAVLEDLGPGD